jgi:hypothetical protein
VRRLAGQVHAAGSVINAGACQVSQVRQTCTVLGCGPRGAWGLTHGINEHRVAMGMATWSSRVVCPEAGLDGTELVRLTLERSHSAQHAQEVLTDLIARHGQGVETAGGRHDHVFLIADCQEAVVIDAAGRYWAAGECHQVGAVSDTAMIRQDWHRLSPGAVQHALDQGWWRDDGCKIDFSGCLGTQSPSRAPALKRWGRATVLLEQQNGHIDLWFMRRLLAEHFEGAVRRQTQPPGEVPPSLANTFIAPLEDGPDAVAMAWCAFGSPSQAVFFPLFLDGDLPALFAEDNLVGDGFLRLPAGLEKALGSREELDKWQARLDHEVEEFAVQARLLKQQGNHKQLQRQATLFMVQALGGAETEGREALRAAAVEDLAFIAE